MQGKLAVLQLLAGTVAFLTQCQTLTLDMQKSGTLPRAEIQGVFFQEVVDACGEVFAEHGYRLAAAHGPRRIYEKPGSTMDFLAWGDFSMGDELVERLNINIRELGPEAFEVDCQPYIVTEAGGHMEKARKISRLKSRKYQEMIDEVKERALSGHLAGYDDTVAWD